MNEKIAAVIIPGNNLSNNKCRNGEIDILLFSEDKIYFNIKNDDDFMLVKKQIEKNNYKVLDNIQYHVDLVKNYLKKEFLSETKNFNLDRFNPDSSFVLYKILCSVGNIIIINSEYLIPIIMPTIRKISEEQIESLNRLSEIIQSENIQVSFVDSSYNVVDDYEGNIQEIIEYINSQRKVNK